MATEWTVPEKGSLVPPETLELEHPGYTARKNAWEFFRHSDELTGGYVASTQIYTGPDTSPSFKETYLIPHVKEADPEVFARRVAAARPPRFVREGIESITGVLTQQEPNRDNYPTKLKEWTSGVNAKKATLQQWIAAELWPLVERYGLCYSLARRPEISGANLKEQEDAIKAAGLPEVLLLVITPENLPWWSVDDIGRFEIVRYTEQKTEPVMDKGYPIDEDEFTRHWWITHEGWWYCDDKRKSNTTPLSVEDAGYWNTDRSPMTNFPLVKWALKDEIGPTETAAYAQLMYFRKDSELHIVEVGAAFPMTWVPTTAGSDDPEETVKGVDQVGGWDPENTGGARPMILETTGVSLTHFIEKRLPELEADASAPYGINDTVGGNDSGVALAHIEAKSTTIYTAHAQSGGESEFAALQPVAEFLGEELTDENRAEWNMNFGTLSDSSMAEILTAFKDAEPGLLFEEWILKKFASMIGGMTADQVDKALEVWKSEREEMQEREQEKEDALFDSESELRRAQTEKTAAEGAAVGLPFAGNPDSKTTPKERGR
jgi:hypothetical protein